MHPLYSAACFFYIRNIYKRRTVRGKTSILLCFSFYLILYKNDKFKFSIFKKAAHYPLLIKVDDNQAKSAILEAAEQRNSPPPLDEAIVQNQASAKLELSFRPKQSQSFHSGLSEAKAFIQASAKPKLSFRPKRSQSFLSQA